MQRYCAFGQLLTTAFLICFLFLVFLTPMAFAQTPWVKIDGSCIIDISRSLKYTYVGARQRWSYSGSPAASFNIRVEPLNAALPEKIRVIAEARLTDSDKNEQVFQGGDVFILAKDVPSRIRLAVPVSDAHFLQYRKVAPWSNPRCEIVDVQDAETGAKVPFESTVTVQERRR